MGQGGDWVMEASVYTNTLASWQPCPKCEGVETISLLEVLKSLYKEKGKEKCQK